MPTVQHEFTDKITEILNIYFPEQGSKILDSSELLQYLNIKTKAANRGSKSRAGFANHYAIYVLIDDYLNNKFHINGSYSDYEGAKFTRLLQRQRELPFGSKLQNHALNSRLNEEFKKYFPTSSYVPIIRDSKTNKYWINENLLKCSIDNSQINIAEAIKDIIDAYIAARGQAFNNFMIYCQQMIDIQKQDPSQAVKFIKDLLKPNIDARVFEIVSYAILKEYYADQQIYWGWSPEKYNIKAIVKKYMESVEEVINIPELMSHFDRVLERGKGAAVIEEIVLQSRVEFNVEAEEQDILIKDVINLN
ncbi:hypothetical protein NO976_01795 [Planktothrix agardhii]|jgi:hypothetical protein|uniref:Restriction endonuclease n=2 Tax=Planktothrix agardhii TaxID=1160 RepID=A0A1J1JE98_PLAAG|nr:hypothetical protein [Planktothrix agardhii]MCF3574529.1 hypothetical protein [Planktothrix agardhii 1812]MCF3581600.1 hypothetical protein [Planktothrix agardhii 1811]MCF3626297.1 hypothetical protein [Planktothrix agardhii 1801]CAD5938082.1 hypothetical protein NO976_01795 [Planktothrix agardhii]CAD5951787.1 hypothetical protein PCC7805_02617 [Planktothrix agardhii]